MENNSFIGEDSSTFNNLILDNQDLYERSVIIKRWKNYIQASGTSSAQGVVPSTGYIYISTLVQLGMVTGRDILNTGGTLQYGDLMVLSYMPIFEAIKKFGLEADKLIVDAQTFELVGKVFRVPAAGGSWAFQSTWRAVTIGA